VTLSVAINPAWETPSGAVCRVEKSRPSAETVEAGRTGALGTAADPGTAWEVTDGEAAGAETPVSQEPAGASKSTEATRAVVSRRALRLGCGDGIGENEANSPLLKGSVGANPRVRSSVRPPSDRSALGDQTIAGRSPGTTGSSLRAYNARMSSPSSQRRQSGRFRTATPNRLTVPTEDVGICWTIRARTGRNRS
jgi:hypothetical protein